MDSPSTVVWSPVRKQIASWVIDVLWTDSGVVVATGVLLLHGDLPACGGPTSRVRHHRGGRGQHRLHRRLSKCYGYCFTSYPRDLKWVDLKRLFNT